MIFEDQASKLLDRISFVGVWGVVHVLSREIDGNARLGGVLAVGYYAKKSGTMWFASRSVGDVTHNAFKYAKNAAEKIARLRQRREGGEHEFAASQSADEENLDIQLRTYGGCLVFEDQDCEIYISFSGAPPKVDEATVFLVGENLGLETPKGYQNPLIPRARQIYNCRLWEKAT